MNTHIEPLTVSSIANKLRHNHTFIADELWLDMSNCTIRCQTNSAELLACLSRYFAPFLCSPGHADIQLQLIEREATTEGFNYQDWAREPEKNGRKDSIFDIDGGRLLRKVRTGMLFLQSQTALLAVGPCLKNDNQVINFINAQHMNWLQQQGGLICHAAAATIDDHGLAICGFSGGGKSTLMLHIMDNDSTQFVSNDRLFLQQKGDQVIALGVAKLPRINPGTALNNPRLKAIIPQSQQAKLLALPKQQLWELEDKYDVDIERTYGKGRIQLQSPLSSLLILNWDRHSDEPTTISPVSIAKRTDLLPAVMKSPGPFYQDTEGHFLNQPIVPDRQRYIDVLSHVNVYEASGGVDFASAKQQLTELMFA